MKNYEISLKRVANCAEAAIENFIKNCEPLRCPTGEAQFFGKANIKFSISICKVFA